jgi:5-methylthioadenosine/S-adenosylhomocysteine deaminase
MAGHNDIAPVEVDLLLTHADWIVTCNETMECITDGALAVSGDTIVSIGPSDRLEKLYSGRSVMNLKGFLVLPGLVNTHTHAAMSCLRGIGDDLPLDRWLGEVIFPAEAAVVDPDMVYWGTLLSAVEMLENGATTFCDGYFFELSAAKAAHDAGIRAVLAQGILDFPVPDQPDPGRAKDHAEAFLESFPGGTSRLRPSLFCHTPNTCSAATLHWVKDLCAKHDILFQTHLSETTSQVSELVKKHNTRPVFYLDDLGILDENTLCVHCTWLDAEEIDRLALRKANVSHCAESNMKLASGVAPVPALLAAGLNVGLGTDGCASNNDLDIFSEMDMVAKLHKVYRKDPVVCSSSDVLRMATIGGASAIGWGDGIGSLEVGKKADIVAVDLNQPHLTPLYDPISHLAYAIKGSDVRHVWVDGRPVVENGRIITVDRSEVMNEVHAYPALLASSRK